jgi:hypothetical protein
VLSLQDSLHCSTLRVLGDVIATIQPYEQPPLDAPTRTKFQQFASNPPLSSFKKLIVLTPRLLHNLHMMSLAKAVLDGLKDCKCKRITLHKHPPISYVPMKDSNQVTVSALKNNQSLKTQIGEGTEPRISIWHCRTREAFLVHVGSAMDAIKKQGHFKAHEEAHEAYVEQNNLVKQAKATLAELDRTTSKGEELPGSLPRSTRKARLQLTHLYLTCKLIFNWTSIRPRKLQRMPGPTQNQLLRTCSSSTCCLWMPSTPGARSSKSRCNPTPTLTYKLYPRKDLGDSCGSHLMTA